MNVILTALLLMAPAQAQTTNNTGNTGTTANQQTTTTQAGTTTSGSTSGATTGAASNVALTDAQIVDVVKTANKGEIDSSKHAKSHAKNKQVQDFAKKMISHHEMSNKEAQQLVTKLKIKAEKNEVSTNLEASAKEEMGKLVDLKGADYDKAYIQAQLNMHQTVLSDIDHELLPNAKNSELKAMLQKTRETVSQHLDEAKKINASL